MSIEDDVKFWDSQMPVTEVAVEESVHPELTEAEGLIRLMVSDKPWELTENHTGKVRARTADPVELRHTDGSSDGRAIFAEDSNGGFYVVHVIEDGGEVERTVFHWEKRSSASTVQEVIYPLEEGELASGRVRHGGSIDDRVEEIYDLLAKAAASSQEEQEGVLSPVERALNDEDTVQAFLEQKALPGEEGQPLRIRFHILLTQKHGLSSKECREAYTIFEAQDWPHNYDWEEHV